MEDSLVVMNGMIVKGSKVKKIRKGTRLMGEKVLKAWLLLTAEAEKPSALGR